ncbi:MAG TPA: class I SAM-dependent methyltransferase [Magnetospirillaceae bacterium]|jgi:S-adenosylmethionine-diacylgycerolhomoserine-N-methlytransferase
MGGGLAPARDWRSDLRVLLQFLRGNSGSGDHAARLNAFYGPQAQAYDAFRERLLPGRRAFMEALPLATGARAIDFGAGTGRHWLYIGDKLADIAQLDLVDLCSPLLDIARTRFANQSQVRIVLGDATTWQAAAPADAIIFSYSLSMMPDWRTVLANALAQLKPGGVLGVIDFCTLPVVPPTPLRPMSRWSRWFWPRWFAHDGVWLRPDVLPALMASGPTLALEQSAAALPYLPFIRAPWFLWIGRPKPQAKFT